ncbi:hypothetical protein [Bacillus oleivorans]|nr:hypothetical protein [Bacillus oleivorans]
MTSTSWIYNLSYYYLSISTIFRAFPNSVGMLFLFGKGEKENEEMVTA